MEREISFDRKKTHFFSLLGVQLREALKMHQKEDLWKRNNKGERDWGNVSEHCLVAAARADVLSDLLKLPPDLKQDLKVATTLHDFHKKREKEIVVAGGLSWDSFDKSGEESTEKMKKAGFSDRIIRLANSSGHTSLAETEQILQQETLSPEDIAYLIMHYVDDYTIGSDWSGPVEDKNGQSINDLDRRMEKNEANQRYKILDEEGKKRFNGRTTFQTQREVGLAVQKRLANLIKESANIEINPAELPTLVDQQIKDKIEKV